MRWERRGRIAKWPNVTFGKTSNKNHENLEFLQLQRRILYEIQ